MILSVLAEAFIATNNLMENASSNIYKSCRLKIQFASCCHWSIVCPDYLVINRLYQENLSMKVLIVNLTRFGDLLQTQPIISGFADQGHEVGLACLEQFAPAADLLTDVSFVASFPGSGLLKSIEENSKGWPQAIGALHAWRQVIWQAFSPHGPDLIVNLTPTLSGRMLTRYLSEMKEDEGGGLVSFTGFGVDEFGFMDNSNAWATYLQASSRKRGNSPCNLVDVFRKICGLGGIRPRYVLRGSPEAVREEVKKTMKAAAEDTVSRYEGAGGRNVKGFVGFQLGASDDRRRWPTGLFASLGDMLWREFNFMPVLLGSQAEQALGERYASKTGAPFLNLLGGTDLPGLAGVLGQCEMLVTNDTGTMHLAAGLNVPTLALFLATAQPWDTSAYQEGVCSLEPDLPDHPRPFDDPCPPGCSCRTAISPETVYALMSGYFQAGKWHNPDGDFAGKLRPEVEKKVRIWVSCRDKNDPEGFLDLKSLSGHEHTERTFWLRIQRYFLRKYLDRQLDREGLADLPFDLEAAKPALAPEFLEELKVELDQAAALLHLMGEQGQALMVNPLPILKNRFMATWQRLQTLWDNSRHFNVLGLLWLAETQEYGDEMERVLGLAGEYEKLCKLWRATLEQ